MARKGIREPVRPDGADESNRFARARPAGPFIAWRDQDGGLRIHTLGADTPTTIGRAEGTLRMDDSRISRLHVEITVRVHDDPPALSVHLLDHSKHGTEYRRLALGENGALRALDPWQQAPRVPARACQLDEGHHDIRLAGERYVLIGGVPVDAAITTDWDDNPVPSPTPRQRQVLVELCRPFFEAPDEIVAPPTNAHIAQQLKPIISEARVSDIMADLYKLYDIEGTPKQSRLRLVNFARVHGVVDAGDYV